jgi:dihydrofolate reductase
VTDPVQTPALTVRRMSKVYAQAAVSLDGFISRPGHSGYDRMFAWHTAGDVETPSADPWRLTYRTNAASATYLRELITGTGAVVVGRTLFDLTKGWEGSHPLGVPVFVVTHRPPPGGNGPLTFVTKGTPFTFVTDGVPSAIDQARTAAGDKAVGVGPGSTVGQALRAGLIDELRFDLVPVVLGGGTPVLDHGGDFRPVTFGDPTVVEGIGVTHLIYRR